MRQTNPQHPLPTPSSRPSSAFVGMGKTPVLGCLVLLAGALPVGAQDTVTLREQVPAGFLHHVSTRVQLSGSLTLPLEKGQASPKSLTITGSSAIEYDERVLTAAAGQVQKTARQYQRLDFQRKVGEQEERNFLRPAVRRLVLLRHNNAEVPFSPDGPLTWGEIDLVRTDVFTPALSALLPDGPVRPGASWRAGDAAVRELTDLQKIEEGGLTCKLEQVTTLSGRRHARVSFTGTVRGPGEDGPSSQRLDGYLWFDLESNHLGYLTVQGVQTLLSPDGKAVGKIEGSFVLTRQPVARVAELDDAALRGLALEPNESNTQLLYDNPELGVRFQYPRHWRVAGVRGRQVALDESRGAGLLVTVEPPARVPSAAQFQQESQTYLQGQKAKVVRVEPARQVQRAPVAIEQFALEIDTAGQKALMDYLVVRDTHGGATLAARLPTAGVAVLRHDVLQIAQSLRITRQQ